MKIKVRNEVFETNSSSTHSLTLNYIGGRKEGDGKIDSKSSFEIWSPLAKVVWFLGIVENAERQFEHCEEFAEHSPEHYMDIVRKEAKDFLEKKENAKYFLKTLNGKIDGEPDYDLDNYSFAELMVYMENASAYEKLDELEEICWKLDKYQAREYILDFKEMIIDAYCELENITREEAFKRFREEHAKDHELEYYLTDANKLEFAVKRLSLGDVNFAVEYEKAENKEEFIKEYALKKKQTCAEKQGDCFNCSKYFGCGNIGECNCDFENYFQINNSFIKFIHGDYFSYAMGHPYNEDEAMNFLTHYAVIAYGGDNGNYKKDLIF